MRIKDFFSSRTVKIRRKTEALLEQHNKPTNEFFILISLATVLAVLGLALNNSAIVIGAMVVAPLVTPIFGLSLAFILFRVKRFCVSLVTLTLGTILSITLATAMAFLILAIEQESILVTDEILARTEPDLLFFLVAFVSGLIGAYAYARHGILERISGIAISVAIIPPLAVVGIQLALGNLILASQSAWLYLFNIFGIVFGSIVMFLLVGFGKEIDKT